MTASRHSRAKTILALTLKLTSPKVRRIIPYLLNCRESKKEHVKLSLEGGLLSVEGEKKYVGEDKSSDSRRQERRYGAFRRSFRLGDGVDPKKISAKFRDGILEITVSKNKESLKKEIEIKIN